MGVTDMEKYSDKYEIVSEKPFKEVQDAVLAACQQFIYVTSDSLNDETGNRTSLYLFRKQSFSIFPLPMFIAEQLVVTTKECKDSTKVYVYSVPPIRTVFGVRTRVKSRMMSSFVEHISYYGKPIYTTNAQNEQYKKAVIKYWLAVWSIILLLAFIEWLIRLK